MSQMLGLTTQERIADGSHVNEKIMILHHVQLEDLLTVTFMEIIYKWKIITYYVMFLCLKNDN